MHAVFLPAPGASRRPRRRITPDLGAVQRLFNRACGTLRGMHYQAAPAAESKLVRCTRGSLYDVVIDLRPASPTYMRWVAVELTADNRLMLYVPEGCAHGFQTLEDNTEVCTTCRRSIRPACARGVRWNDSAFGIHWPLPVTLIADRDQQYPDYHPLNGVEL